MQRLLGSITRTTEVASGMLLLLATVAMFAMVITRYLAGWSDPSVEILARYAMIWATFLALAGAVRTDSEIRFTLVETLLPGRSRKVFRTVGLLVAAALVAGLAASGIALVDETMEFNEVMPTALRWPIWLFHAAVPAGAIVVALQFLAQAVTVWRESETSGTAPASDAHYS